MSRRAAFKQAELTRAIRGAQAAGIEPRGCRIDPTTGEIELIFGSDNRGTGNSFDRIAGRG